MPVRKKRASVRRISIKHDDLQWRVSNSLLVLVFGIMFLGYGVALWTEQPATGLAVIPGFGGGGFVQAGSEWSNYMHMWERNAQGVPGPDTAQVRFAYNTGTVQTLTNPVIADGKVFFGDSLGNVYALDWRTGSRVWLYNFPVTYDESDTPVYTPIATNTYANGMLYVGTSDGTIYWFNASTGKSLNMNYKVSSRPLEPIIVGNTLYTTTSDGKVYAVYATGANAATLKWSATPTVSGTQCVVKTPLAYSSSKLYMGTQNCGVVSLNETDGKLLKNFNGKTVWYTPVINNQTVYFGTSEDKFYATDMDLNEKFSVINRRLAAPVTITLDGKYALVITASKFVPVSYGLDIIKTELWGADKGKVAMGVALNSMPREAPAVDSSKIYLPGEDWKVCALSIADNYCVWTYNALGAPSAPALADNGVFFTSHNGKLYAIGPDKSGPAASNVNQSKDAPNYGETVTLSANWTDNKGLASATLELKEGAAAAVNKTTIDMTGLSNSSVFTLTATQASGTVMKWKIYAFDTDGNDAVTLEKSFVVYEKVPPVITSTGQTDKLGAGSTNTLTVSATDNAALKEATLSTNETGTWKNWTDKYGSKAALTGTAATATFAWNNTALPIGAKVSWKAYVKDMSGNEVVSDTKTFEIVADATPPTAVFVGQASGSIGVGGTNYLFVKWTDNAALARAELWVGEKMVSPNEVEEMLLSGKSAWSNFTYKPKGGDATVVSWFVRAYDFAGNLKDTAASNFMVVSDKTAPTITNLEQSADSVEAGKTVTLSADITDDVALKSASFEINGAIVQTLDLGAEKTASVSYDYSPNSIGPVSWRITATDTTGNKKTSDMKAFQTTATVLECALPQPLPSQYGACTNKTRSRVVYTCDKSTGSWTGSIETEPCGTGYTELPVAYMLVGSVLIVLAISSLVLYRKKYSKGEKKAEEKHEEPAQGAVQW